MRWHFRINVYVNWHSSLFLKTSRDTSNLKFHIKWNLSNIHTDGRCWEAKLQNCSLELADNKVSKKTTQDKIIKWQRTHHHNATTVWTEEVYYDTIVMESKSLKICPSFGFPLTLQIGSQFVSKCFKVTIQHQIIHPFTCYMNHGVRRLTF